MSEQLQLLAIARHLSSLINQQITSSPAEPDLVISALKMLIPEAQDFFIQVEQLPNEEEQWNHLINFIETQVFDEGMQFGFDKLDTEEIIEVYKVVIEMVEQAIGDQDDQHEEGEQNKRQGFGKARSNQANQQNQSENQPENHQQSNRSNRTAPGQQSSSNQHLQHNQIPSKQPTPNIKNQQSLNYIENVRKQQQQKKKQLQSHPKPTGIKPINRQNSQKPQQPKTNPLKSKNKNQTKPPNHNENKEKSTNPQTLNKLKSISVLSKPDLTKSKHQQSSNQPHTKSAIRQNYSNKNTQPLKEFDQKHNKSQNDSKKQTTKKQRPKTTVNKQNLPKQSFEPNESNMKNKKSQINLNQKQKTYGEQVRPKSCSRNKRESNIMKQPLDQVVIQTIQQVMKKDKKVSQRDLKSNPLMRDNYVTEMMQKAARRYKYQAKSHKTQQKQQQQKQTKSSVLLCSTQQPPKKDNYMKLLKQKQQAMQSQVLNSQLKYYYQLRDKKVAYIKHMHKLMQKLEKERNIDLHKKQTELTRQEKQKIRKKIQQADNMFTDNMKGIKDNYLKERQKNRVNAGEQIKVLTEMQRNLVKNKENELNVMKCLWEQERLKLDLIIKDEQKIKGKLQDMYRKTKV